MFDICGMVVVLMERIHIPIKKVSSGFGVRTLAATMGSTLTLGILVGTFAGNTLTLPLPENLRSVLGATGAATFEQEAPKGEAAKTPTSGDAFPSSPPITQETPENAPTIPSAPVNNATISSAQKAALSSDIEEKNLAIEQNIAEIKRIKDESVALITSFNQNCGDWTDTCATPYRDALEKNNTAYEELLVTQRALYKALADAERALRDAE